MKHIYVYSHIDFDDMMKIMSLDSSNVGLEDDKAFISITASKNVIEAQLEEYRAHYFDGKSNNVLNIEFDDIATDHEFFYGIKCLGINETQAKTLFDFIEENKGKNFYIHCMAGRSRSQGVCRYILDMYGEEYGYTEESCRKENPCTTPNMYVVSMLKREYYKNNYKDKIEF